ncbi:signal peptidase I [Streptomyces boncukensis]|uniref:Signal peptidase I n=1 Tax=Streptomyces boncukensis TaxID=2711219 RepID=A0A6G4X6P6_9ACTN|nr:signal peptidase I [Streptomyces boncukensis]NGO73058.1 signal peptidase I [Streptomyces boncukensis]
MDTDGTDARHDEPERDRSSASDGGGRLRSRSFRLAACALGVVLVTLLTSAFAVQPFLVPSSSMEPALRVGDRVLVNKLAYRFGNHPERGDVVVFDGTGSFVEETGSGGNPLTSLLRKAGATVGLTKPAESDYVKRVIAVGGDRVRCCDRRGRIEVNGAPVDEPYLHSGDAASDVPFDIRVPRGRLWVMGDHRSRSSDSRDHLGDPGGGSVPVDRVIGRAAWVGWPPARLGSVGRAGGGHG